MPPNPLAPARPAAAGRSRALLACGAVVLAFQVFSAWGFRRFQDIHAADELTYLLRGQELLAGDPYWQRLLGGSGPYCLLSGLVNLCVPAERVQDVVLALVAASSGLALYWAAAALAPPAAAAFAAQIWCSGNVLVGNHCGVYLFGATLAFAAAGALARGRTLAGGLLFLSAGFARGENLLWLIGASLAYLALRGRNRAALILLAAGALALWAVSSAEGGARPWIGFAQAYGLGRAERAVAGGEVGAPPASGQALHHEFDDPWQRVESDFGDARSISAALRANPRAFAEHVRANAARLPAEVARTLRAFPAAPAPGRAARALAAALIALGSLALALRARRPAARRSDESPWIAPLLLGCPLFLASSLLLRPRSDYYAPLVLPAAWLALAGAREICDRVRPLAERTRRTGRFAGAAVVLALALPFLAPRPIDRPPVHLRFRELLRVASSLSEPVLYTARDPYCLEQLLGGRELRAYRADQDDGQTSVALVHVEDLAAHAQGLLAAEEQAAVDRLLDPGVWRPREQRDGVLVLERAR